MEFQINGIDNCDRGMIRTSHGFNLGRFDQPHTPPPAKGKERAPKRVANVKDVLSAAMKHIDEKCANMKRCNDYFEKLAIKPHLKMTLRQILDEKKIFIFQIVPNADTAKDAILPVGYTEGWGKSYAHIGIHISQCADSMKAAATLVHEFAHVAGAPGRDVAPDSHAAEMALIHCGLKRYYDEDATG